MKHVSDMRHNSESDNHIILEKGVSLQIVLRPVQALIPRTPLADTTRIVWIVCTVNLNQPRIVGGIELPRCKGESPLSRHAHPKTRKRYVNVPSPKPTFRSSLESQDSTPMTLFRARLETHHTQNATCIS